MGKISENCKKIKNIYWKHVVANNIWNKVGNYEPIKLGIRQECVLSLYFFSLFTKILMRDIKDRLGVQVWDYNINNLHYADACWIFQLQSVCKHLRRPFPCFKWISYIMQANIFL